MFIEIGVNELNTLYRTTGLTKDQVYRVINSGNLEPNALTVKFGDFVKWDGSKWVTTTTKLATTTDVNGIVNKWIERPAGTTGTYTPEAGEEVHLGSIIATENGLIRITSQAQVDPNTGDIYYVYQTTDLATEIANKVDANKVVAISDAYVLRRGQIGQGWYKLAEATTPRNNYNINSVFDIVVSTSSLGEFRASFVMSVRYEGTGVVNVFTKSLFSDSWSSDYPIKIVTTKLSSNSLKVELFFGIYPSNTITAVYSGISLSEQNAGNYGGTNVKNAWTYTSYEDVAGSGEPTSDAGAGRDVIDVDVYVRQHSISSPTDGNIVVMDANGNIKDSGVNISQIIS